VNSEVEMAEHVIGTASPIINLAQAVLVIDLFGQRSSMS
jgi:hypothetical protein